MMSSATRIGHRNVQLPLLLQSGQSRRLQVLRAPVSAKAANVTQKLKSPSSAKKGTQRIQPKKAASKKPSKPSIGTIVKRKVQQESRFLTGSPVTREDRLKSNRGCLKSAVHVVPSCRALRLPRQKVHRSNLDLLALQLLCS